MDAQKRSSFAFLISTVVLFLSLASVGPWVSKHVQREIFLGIKSPLIKETYDCHQDYTVEILSFDPWVIYINNFIREEEIGHLLEVSKNNWAPSVVFHKSERGEDVSVGVDEDRLSSSTIIPHTDEVAKCLLKRTRLLLGNVQHESIESPQLIKYTGGERFRPHLDTIDAEKAQKFHPDYPKRPWDRLLTTLVYLGDNCTGGETYFPKVVGVGSDADGEKFSRATNRSGLLVKPKKGNAIIWKNLLINGSVDDRLVHAGLSVKSGEKLAMNLFTTYYLDSPMIGGKRTST